MARAEGQLERSVQLKYGELKVAYYFLLLENVHLLIETCIDVLIAT